MVQTSELTAQHTLTALEAQRIAALTDQGQRLTALPAGCPTSRADLVVGLFVMPTDAVVPVEYSLDGCSGLATSADASRLVSRPLRALLTDLTG